MLNFSWSSAAFLRLPSASVSSFFSSSIFAVLKFSESTFSFAIKAINWGRLVPFKSLKAFSLVLSVLYSSVIATSCASSVSPNSANFLSSSISVSAESVLIFVRTKELPSNLPSKGFPVFFENSSFSRRSFSSLKQRISSSKTSIPAGMNSIALAPATWFPAASESKKAILCRLASVLPGVKRMGSVCPLRWMCASCALECASALRISGSMTTLPIRLKQADFRTLA